MERVAVYGAIAAIVAIALVAVLVLGHGGSQNGLSATSTAPQSGNGTQSVSGPLFSSEPYYGYSYQIYPGSISPQARSAMDGYNMTLVQSAGGTENITLSTQGRSGSGTLQAGEKLYIVETTFGDDAPGYEGSVGDDGFVVVGPSGHVVGTFGI